MYSRQKTFADVSESSEKKKYKSKNNKTKKAGNNVSGEAMQRIGYDTGHARDVSRLYEAPCCQEFVR